MNGKVKGALVAGLLFFILSHPTIYILVDGVLGGVIGRTSGPGGCPTTLGLLVHTAVFAAVTYYGVGL